jgi:hypothetical protein
MGKAFMPCCGKTICIDAVMHTIYKAMEAFLLVLFVEHANLPPKNTLKCWKSGRMLMMPMLIYSWKKLYEWRRTCKYNERY